jgi:hypothetical protein
MLSWLLPGTTLALMPKCPICFAGYLSLITGSSISLAAAAVTRSALVALAALTLTVLMSRGVVKVVRAIAAGRRTSTI